MKLNKGPNVLPRAFKNWTKNQYYFSNKKEILNIPTWQKVRKIYQHFVFGPKQETFIGSTEKVKCCLPTSPHLIPR